MMDGRLQSEFNADNSDYSGTPDLPRRTVRNRIKPKKYEHFLDLSPTKRKAHTETQSSDVDDFDTDEICIQRSSALFTNDDVNGQDMFKFKSRHTKHDLQNKVKATISNIPNFSESPRKKLYTDMMSKLCEATPKHVKDKIKKRIIREVESDSAESDFSNSSSDFIPEADDSESESSESHSASEEEECEKANKIIISKSKDNKMKQKDSEYIVTPDNYFMMHSSKKITTSDHTLARLKNLNLNNNIEEAHIEVSSEHKTKIYDLNKSYEQLFDRWLCVLSENFNIILYGIGSKRFVLNQFQKQKLHDFPCIVVNGFFPSLTIKSILETIVIDFLENNYIPSNTGDIVNLIDSQLTENGVDLFLIIHNIDGSMLRNAKAQGILASISQIKNLHTITTIDHINAPLLWDHSKLSKFNFTWWDVTTFMPYTEETSFENSLMTHRSGALQLSSLRSVYQSLTTNAKGIFDIIIQYQLQDHKQTQYQGLPLKDLYSKSREQFLVSSDVALRAQLTEFLDHKLIKIKRTYDGNENLIIPIENSLLQQFLEQNS